MNRHLPITTDFRSRRILMVAFACHPEWTMESRLGWRRALLAAQRHHVTVVCGPMAQRDDLREQAAAAGLQDRIRFVRVPHGVWSDRLCSSATLFYQGYRLWHRRAFRIAQRLHKQSPFDLVHQVNFCGYREPGYAWRLGIPFVWGPIGGTQHFPLRLLNAVDPLSGAREILRNILNAFQLRYSPRVRRAASCASTVLSATTTSQRDLKECLGLESLRDLETGLDCSIGPRRTLRDKSAPLKILWAGRLRAWKAFPLLLHALHNLPQDFKAKVRVMGVGSCERTWRRLADRLGVSDRLEWVGWGSYAETLPHYQWADLFAFTSLRDTSGTGLIESLAAGAPIIGVDHQGAADIMDARSAVRIPVTHREEMAQRFAEAIVSLGHDPDRLLQMSLEAQNLAASFCWEDRASLMEAVYTKALLEDDRRSFAAEIVAQGVPYEPFPTLPPRVGRSV